MEFHMTSHLLTGNGVVAANGERIASFGRRCLLVTGASSARKSGALADITAVLDAHGVAYTIFDGVAQNPTMSSCLAAGAQAAAFGAEFIIGIGGGSALDAAKVAAVSAANPGEDENGIYSRQWPAPPLPVILVGTTAGTGSEVTPVSVLTDASGRKKSIRDDRLYAAVSFGDAAYTMSLPTAFTISTGIDALAHCAESYFCKKANEVSRAASIQGVYLLLPALRAVADGVEPDYALRETLYNASILGGLAISVTGTVFPHNLGYYFTETFHLPHGIACALFLPELIEHAGRSDEAYTAAFFRRIGTDRETFLSLVRDLMPPVEVRMSEAEIAAALPRWENNSSVINTVGNVTVTQVEEILRRRFLH